MSIRPAPPTIPGDLASLIQLASSMSQIAATASDALNRLNSANGELQWTGDAADAFRNQIGDLPTALSKVNASFSSAYQLLNTYVGNLEDYRRQYDALYVNYGETASEHEAARRCQQDASTSGQDDSYWRQQADQLGQETDELFQKLVNIYSEAAVAATTLKNQLDGAANAGIRNDFGNMVGRYGGDVVGFAGNVLDHLWNAIKDFAQAVWQLAKDLKSAFDALARGDWGAFAKALTHAVEDIHNLAKALNDVLSTLALVLQFVPGVGEILDTVLLVTALVMVASDLVVMGAATAEGDQQLEQKAQGDLGGDALSLATQAIPMKLQSMAVSRAKGAAESSMDDVIQGASDLKTAAGRGNRLSEAFYLDDVKALPAHATFEDLGNLRDAYSDLGIRARILNVTNPTLLNAHGISISYHAAAATIEHADEIKTIVDDATHPEGVS